MFMCSAVCIKYTMCFYWAPEIKQTTFYSMILIYVAAHKEMRRYFLSKKMQTTLRT